MNQNTSPRILIADDEELFRRILEITFNKFGWRDIISVSTGSQAVKNTVEYKPDIILLDINMPDMDGIAALSIIKYLTPDIPTIILTSHADPAFLIRAQKLGAEAFLSKKVSSNELVETIRMLVSGERLHIPPDSRLEFPLPTVLKSYSQKEELEKPLNSPNQALTKKEKLILTLLAAGFDNQSITEKAGISKNTVKTHMRNIYSKLNVSDRTQAAIWAIQNGFGLNLISPYQT